MVDMTLMRLCAGSIPVSAHLKQKWPNIYKGNIMACGNSGKGGKPTKPPKKGK